jgi:hypothetical protein
VLFLFVMQAFSDTLKERLSNADVNDAIDFKYFRVTATQRGRLLNQNYKAKETDFKLRDLLKFEFHSTVVPDWYPYR